MKKFSLLEEEIKPKYEVKDSLRNEIYSILEDTLSIKISNEESLDKDIDINGKEELVEKIKSLIDDVRIKERTFTLETVKANVHRNFDMNWLNEQIDVLKKKVKIGSKFVLTENIKDVKVDEQYKAEILNYFVKKLHGINKIKGFDHEFVFSYEPSEGVFKFTCEDEDLTVIATPFYNDDSGIPIEVFTGTDTSNHAYIEHAEFDVKNILFKTYLEIIEDFFHKDFDDLLKIPNKNYQDVHPKGSEEPEGWRPRHTLNY